MTQDASHQPPRPLAAIVCGRGDPADAILGDAVRSLTAEGHAVSGFLQRATPARDDCCAMLHLENIAKRERVLISQPLGANARGCRLDPRALADLVMPLMAEIDARPALLVINRFGAGEAEGHGFRRVMEKTFELGVPLLTIVRHAYLEPWRAFTGGLGEELPADADRILAWSRAVIRANGAKLADAAI